MLHVSSVRLALNRMWDGDGRPWSGTDPRQTSTAPLPFPECPHDLPIPAIGALRGTNRFDEARLPCGIYPRAESRWILSIADPLIRQEYIAGIAVARGGRQ